jgi:hypothetical protein
VFSGSRKSLLTFRSARLVGLRKAVRTASLSLLLCITSLALINFRSILINRMKTILIALGITGICVCLGLFERRSRKMAIKTLQGYVDTFKKTNCVMVLEYYRKSLVVIGRYKFKGPEFGVESLAQFDQIARRSLKRAYEDALKRNSEGTFAKGLKNDLDELDMLQDDYLASRMIHHIGKPGMEAATSTL